MNAVGQAQLGETLFKVGRSTKVTYGSFQEICETDTVKSWQYKDASGFEEVSTLECAVVMEYGDHLFGEPGDSGSLLFNSQGQLVGLYFGGNDRTNVSYFTPIEVVFDDIKRITGCVEVDLPE